MHTSLANLDPIPVARAISDKLFDGQPIPIHKLQILGCLVSPKVVEYYVKVGGGEALVTCRSSFKSHTWEADIIQPDERTNVRIRFFGTGESSIGEYDG